jgi:DNA-binding MarR family transcriptional regulator
VPGFIDDTDTSPGPRPDTGDAFRGLDEAAPDTCPGPEAAAASAGPAPDGTTGACPSPQQLALLEQWNTLQSGFRRLTDQLLCDVQTETGLGPSAFHVLWFLLTTPGNAAPMNQLSNTLKFTTAGTTNLADRLVDAGLLERRPAPADRRVTLAVLTAKGRQTATTAAITLANTLHERVIAPLGPDALAKLADAVSSLAPDPRTRG